MSVNEVLAETERARDAHTEQQSFGSAALLRLEVARLTLSRLLPTTLPVQRALASKT